MNYLRLRNFNKSSLRNPASRSIAKSVPFGRSFGWRGTTARLFVVGFRKIKWLPVAWSSAKPLAWRNAMTVLDVMLGSRGMSEIKRRKEGLGVCRDRFAMLLQASDICLDGIPRHTFCFAESSAVGNAPCEGGDNNRVSSLRFRAENDMVMRKFCFHNDVIVALCFQAVNVLYFIDDVRIYPSTSFRAGNRALSPDEVKRLYNMGR